MSAVLRYACVRTKGGVTPWMDLVTVHQDGWETTAISVRNSLRLQNTHPIVNTYCSYYNY